MNNALPKNNLIATEKAIVAAAAAISLVKRVPAPLKSIADQVVRSASSVPANLAEGHGRSGRDRIAPLAHRLRLSQGSRHTPSAPCRTNRNQRFASRPSSPTLRRSTGHDMEIAQPKTVRRYPGSLPGEWNTPPQRGAGHGFVPEKPYGDASRSAQGPCRAPSGSAMRSALPATRQAAGAPSAWSQPSPQPPRDHADGATLGRRDARASRRPRRPESRTGSGAAVRNQRTEAAAGDRSRPGPAEIRVHRRAEHGFVPEKPYGDASRSAQGPCRAPSGSAMRSALPATR